LPSTLKGLWCLEIRAIAAIRTQLEAQPPLDAANAPAAGVPGIFSPS